MDQAETQQEAVRRVREVSMYKGTINKDVSVGEPQEQHKKQKLLVVELFLPQAQRGKERLWLLKPRREGRGK